MHRSKYYSIFYMVIGIILLVLGITTQETYYVWGAIVLACVSVYWGIKYGKGNVGNGRKRPRSFS